MSWFMPGTNHQWAALLHLATWHCTWWWHSSGIVEHGGRVGFCGLVLLQKKMVLPINQTKRQQGIAVCATYDSCYSNHVIFGIFRWETLIRWYLKTFNMIHMSLSAKIHRIIIIFPDVPHWNCHKLWWLVISFPIVSPSFSHNFPTCSHCFPMGFPRVFPWFSHLFPQIFPISTGEITEALISPQFRQGNHHQDLQPADDGHLVQSSSSSTQGDLFWGFWQPLVLSVPCHFGGSAVPGLQPLGDPRNPWDSEWWKAQTSAGIIK